MQFKKTRGMSVEFTIVDLAYEHRDEVLRNKKRPTSYEKINMEENRNKGIEFYEKGYRIENLSVFEKEKLDYFFVQGYEIARRKELANDIIKNKKLIKK